jgi:hypothetical protein
VNGPIPNTTLPYSLPMRYITAGVIAFGFFATGFGLHALFFGGDLGLSIEALTHLLTLGALMTFVMGAVFQLTTVAFMVSLQFERVARWILWLYIIGITGFCGSMNRWWIPGLIVFGIQVAVSLYVYAGIVLLSVFRSVVHGPMRRFVQSAHLYLVMAVSVALLLVESFREGGVLKDHFKELLMTHIALAVLGFFSFLIMGYSFKLLPMFTLSHGFSITWQRYVFGFLHAGIGLLVTGIWFHATGIILCGLLFITLAFALQLTNIRVILKHRMRRRLEPPILITVAATVLGGFGTLFTIAAVLWGLAFPVWQAIVSCYLLGWVVLAVMGYAYKIIPFLVWTKRYSKKIGREKVPLMVDIFNVNQSVPVLILYMFGVAVFCLSTAFSWSFGVTAGGILVSFGIAGFVVPMLRLIDVRRIPVEWKESDGHGSSAGGGRNFDGSTKGGP